MHEAMWLALLMSAVALASGGPALEKGVIYVQKSYHYTNTLDMNIEVSVSLKVHETFNFAHCIAIASVESTNLNRSPVPRGLA